jgi:hypothetical protein
MIATVGTPRAAPTSTRSLMKWPSSTLGWISAAGAVSAISRSSARFGRCAICRRTTRSKIGLMPGRPANASRFAAFPPSDSRRSRRSAAASAPGRQRSCSAKNSQRQRTWRCASTGMRTKGAGSGSVAGSRVKRLLPEAGKTKSSSATRASASKARLMRKWRATKSCSTNTSSFACVIPGSAAARGRAGTPRSRDRPARRCSPSRGRSRRPRNPIRPACARRRWSNA